MIGKTIRQIAIGCIVSSFIIASVPVVRADVGVQILTPAVVHAQTVDVDVLTDGLGATLFVNGFSVARESGMMTETGETTVTFPAVKLKAGPNDVRVVADAAPGTTPASATETIEAPGAPVKFTLQIKGTLVADGTTPARVTVSGIDAWGNSAAPDSPVNVTVAQGAGRLRVPQEQGDLPNSSAVVKKDDSGQVDGKLDANGQFVCEFIPGYTSGDVSLAATSPDSATLAPVAYQFFVNPNGRKPIVIGLASVGVGAVPGSVDGDDIFDNGGSRRGRFAAYGTGSIGKSTVVTAAYETANRLSPTYPFGQYVADPNGQTYLSYGDASTREDDALSLTRLYAKVENGRNSLTYGEFAPYTDATQSAGSYSMLLSGVKAHLATKNGKASLNAYTAGDDVGFGRIVIDPLGLATADTFLQPNLIVGSDTLTLVVLDRRTGAAISQQLLVRNVDYAINYSSGTIRFINVPLPLDPNFNPQVIVATYEYDAMNTGARTSGANANVALGRSAQASVGFMEDTGYATPYSLFTQQVNGSSAGGTWSIERDASHQGAPYLESAFDGQAYSGRFDLGSKLDRLTGSFDSTSSGYYNPYGGFSTPGLTSYEVAAEHRLPHGGSVSLSYDGQETADSFGGNYRQQRVAASIREVLSDRFSIDAGLSHLTESAYSSFSLPTPITPYPGPFPNVQPNPVSLSAGATEQSNLGFNWKVTRNVTLAANRVTNLGGQQNATSPSQTTAQAVLSAGADHLYVNELWSSAPQYTAAGETNAYASLTQATHSQVIGFDRDISKNTSVTSQYVVDDAMGAQDAYAAFGVRQRFKFNQFLSGDGFLQTGSDLGGGSITDGSQDHFGLYGFDLAFHQKDRAAATVSVQNRTGLDGGSSMNAGLDGRLSADFTANGSMSVTNLGVYSQHDARIGLAYRPNGNARGAGLFSFQTYNSNVFNAGGQANVMSYDEVYRPSDPWELALHLAYKLEGDGFYAAHTTLYAFRLDRRLDKRLDLGAEIQSLSFASLAGTGQRSFAAELGYRLTNSVRVAAGYNFSGAADPSLLAQPVKRGVFASVTSVLDNIFGWGASK